MGRDKALLRFRQRPLVAGAVQTLQSFCEVVSISGNREDLGFFAPVVREARIGAGPAAGIEAGLLSSSRPWVLFIPVDVPLVPGWLLRLWAEAVLSRDAQSIRLSFLRAGGERQPAFCMLHTSCAAPLTAALDRGERKLGRLFEQIAAELGPAALWVSEAEEFVPKQDERAPDVAALFSNINTPEDLVALTHGEAQVV